VKNNSFYPFITTIDIVIQGKDSKGGGKTTFWMANPPIIPSK